MSIWDSLDERLERWEAGSHDAACEQRERSFICHCRKRAREAAGFTAPPTEDLYFPPPSCPHCGGELWIDDVWHCNPCGLTWDSSGRGDSAQFVDNYGTDFGGEQFGQLLRDLARDGAR